jgi:phage-related minor tail protein
MAETLLDTLLVQVRTDTRQATQGLGSMRRDIDLLGVGADSAARRMENAFAGFVRSGKFNFESLRQLALSVLADIASSALRGGIDGLLGSLGGGGRTGSGGLLSGVLGALGLPGRATGGPVQARTPYLVGERGPELFVPHNAGRIEARSGASRSVAITINVSGNTGDARTMARSANQVALSVRRALDRAERLA